MAGRASMDLFFIRKNGIVPREKRFQPWGEGRRPGRCGRVRSIFPRWIYRKEIEEERNNGNTDPKDSKVQGNRSGGQSSGKFSFFTGFMHVPQLARIFF